jgi:methyl-accepting chemotaxis protein
MGGGLRVRLWILVTIGIPLLLVLLGFIVLRTTTGALEPGIERQLLDRAESLANLLARASAWEVEFNGTRADIGEFVDSVAREEGVRFVVVRLPDGTPVQQRLDTAFAEDRLPPMLRQATAAGDGRLNTPDLLVLRADITYEPPLVEADSSGGYGDLLMGGAPPAPAEPPKPKTVGAVYVALSKERMTENLHAAKRDARMIMGIVVAGAVLVVLFGTLWVTRPLARMVDAAEAMARGEYQTVTDLRARRFEVQEIGALADSFAGMRDRLAEVADQARRIAEGDLTRRVEAAGQLGDAFNAMVASLSHLVGQIKKASLQIASSSSQILAASKQAEKGSAEQASSIAQTTTTMDELLSASKQIASSADAVVQIAEKTLSAAQSGEEAVHESIKGMEEIAENNRQTAERTLELSEKNQEIGNVVDLIDEIADKSDLLALNAAIEGAKAGEAGKGFAVVATEMRALAENVIASTKEIKGLISEIQKASNASVLATEGQMKATERGTHVAEKTAEHLQQILQMVEQTTEAAKQISLATQQQRTGTEQVVQSMSEIAKIAKSNVAGAAQTTSSTVELASLADELRQAVSRFQLGSEDG